MATTIVDALLNLCANIDLQYGESFMWLGQ